MESRRTEAEYGVDEGRRRHAVDVEKDDDVRSSDQRLLRSQVPGRGQRQVTVCGHDASAKLAVRVGQRSGLSRDQRFRITHRNHHVHVRETGGGQNSALLVDQVLVSTTDDRHHGDGVLLGPHLDWPATAVGRSESNSAAVVDRNRAASRAALTGAHCSHCPPPVFSACSSSASHRSGSGQVRRPTAIPARSSIDTVACCSPCGRSSAMTMAGTRAAATSAMAFWPP